MHTVIMLGTGLVLLAACYFGSGLMAEPEPAARRNAMTVFLFLWLLVSFANLIVGVAVAGYSFLVELVIFIPTFGLPAAIAYALRQRI